MAEEEPIESGPSHAWAWRITWSLMALMFFYPLSLGPAVLIYDAGMMPSGVAQVLQVIYQPLEDLSRKSTVAQRILDAYLRLWGRKN